LVEALSASDVAYRLPQAPGSSWWPQRFNVQRSENEPWLGEALATIDHELAALVGGGLPLKRIVLVGFSQGACLVAEHLARRPQGVAGAAVLTGALVGADDEWRGPDGRLDGIPVAFTTSALDGWVPVERVRSSAQAFVEAGADVTLQIDNDPDHRIGPDAFAAVERLLAGVAA
ncbi:MAG: phospholipase, partial [Thermoleophilia bacterium]|nr:phospholipase [Thermoleophilia bacterium]